MCLIGDEPLHLKHQHIVAVGFTSNRPMHFSLIIHMDDSQTVHKFQSLPNADRKTIYDYIKANCIPVLPVLICCRVSAFIRSAPLKTSKLFRSF